MSALINIKLLFGLSLGILAACNATAQKIRAYVIAVNPTERSYMIKIEPTQLQVAVGPGDAQVPYSGHWIEARMDKMSEGFRLEDIWPSDPQALRIMEQLNNELRRDTVARGSRVFRAQGEFMPRFAQFDQNGMLFTHDRLMGKYSVLNFIFTRCQNPVMCPASTARMVELQKCLRAAGLCEKTQLVSITLDPAFDTPGILTQYVLSHAIDGNHHWFLTGPKSALEDLKSQLGVLTKYEDGTLDHTLATLLIDPHGKIIYRHEGSQWTDQTYYNKIVKALKPAKKAS